MSEDKNIYSIEGAQAKDLGAEATRAMRKALPHMITHAEMVAKLQRAKYDALVGEGFEPSQALELLCKTPLVF